MRVYQPRPSVRKYISGSRLRPIGERGPTLLQSFHQSGPRFLHFLLWTREHFSGPELNTSGRNGLNFSTAEVLLMIEPHLCEYVFEGV